MCLAQGPQRSDAGEPLEKSRVAKSKVKCSKISKTFLFLFPNEMSFIRIGNREDPDQTAPSSEFALFAWAFLTVN